MPSQAELERNLKLYPWYSMALESLFWAPVFILLFSSRFSITQVLQLEGIYYVAVVLLEVPSGYVSDRVGRKSTLIVAACLLAVAYAVFFLGDTFAVFVVAKVLMAAGFSFKSGTDASFHYDSHQALGRSSSFGDAEARVSSLNFRGAACAALLGGFAGMGNLSVPFALSAIASFVAMGIMAPCVEPTRSAETGRTIYHPFHDKGSVGVFLKGFFGYNSNPNIPEVILWFLAMLFGLNMWRRFYY